MPRHPLRSTVAALMLLAPVAATFVAQPVQAQSRATTAPQITNMSLNSDAGLSPGATLRVQVYASPNARRASVTLGDNQAMGANWSFLSGGANVDPRFARDISGGESGFKYMINTAGGTKATLTALANDSRTRILATPRILVKSGEQANINVGTDIPIVTGRQTDGSNTGGNSNLLQSISYRSTGVILNVSPVVYSNNRVDLTVSQEVSDGGGGASTGSDGGDVSSPPIKRTSLETSLTLQSGGSIFMGGLINESHVDSNAGVPWLKDLPVLGYLFGKQSRTKSKDEVVMLIQPYIIDGAEDAREITEKLRRMIEPAINCDRSLAECRSV